MYNGYRVFPGSKERPGRDAGPSPPSSAAGHERVELYLYSPCGPYSLYRASVPVQGCTFTDRVNNTTALTDGLHEHCAYHFFDLNVIFLTNKFSKYINNINLPGFSLFTK